MRLLHTLLLVLALSSAFAAQTVGVIGTNDLTVNGLGSGAASCHTINLPAGPITITFRLAGVPNAFVIGALGTCQFGSLPVPGGTSLDLSLATLAVPFDGTGTLAPPPPAFPFPSAVTNSAGIWIMAMAANVPATPIATLQLAQVSPVFPAGINFSQAHALRGLGLGAATLCPTTVGNTVSPLSDDGSVNITMSTPFTFYGTAYSSVFVNMNGNLTFTAGDTDFSPSEADMLGGVPRIAPCWDDFTPNDPTQGTVRFSDSGGNFRVEWFNVRHYGSAACGFTAATGFQDSNTFCVELNYASSSITFRYGVMILCNLGLTPSSDSLVGISPGSGISTPNNLNLSSGIVVAPSATRALYEAFGLNAFGAFDLGPTWGALTGITFTSPGGAGPYTKTPF